MQTRNYIELTKKKLKIESDYALAKVLGVSRAAIGKYLTGERVMDDYTAAKIAQVLDLPEIKIIAEANQEREKDAKKKSFWKKLAKETAAMVLVAIAHGAGIDEAKGVDNLYIMRNRRKSFLKGCYAEA